MEGAGGFRRGMIMPTLITQLKSILEQYPDDGQILKELIQNAEDAGASKVVFLMDYTTYGTDPDKLHHKDLAQFQGPALYAYNNAVFSERDWEGIRRLQDSIKADDPLKVGKFGLGFKSIFHITDLPSIYSGHNIGFIDPHKRYFEVNVPGQSSPEKTSSYDWNFDEEKQKNEIFRLSHQFEPFLQDIFGVKKDNFGYFNGTMFRFPLRNNNMHSDLSNTCYVEQNIKQLVNYLEAESEIILLFLKKIEIITFYKKHENGCIEKLINIEICKNNLPKVLERRQKLCKNIKDNITNWYMKKSFSVTYPMEITVESSNGHQKSSKWVVCQRFAGKDSKPTKNECIDGYLPLVGVASKIPSKTSVPVSNEPYGQMFCFLPLPIEEKSPTGFNFHVHGSFAVDQNRRHIKWFTAGQDLNKLQDKDLIWNKFLIEKILPTCLNELIHYLIEWHKKLIKNSDPHLLEIYSKFIYSIIPDKQKISYHWHQFVDILNNIIAQFFHFFSVTTMTWKSSISYLNPNMSEELQSLCKKIMTSSKNDLACLPSHIIEIMPSTKARVLIADELCENFKSVQIKIEFIESEKLILLKYFFENIGKLQNLIKVRLLPLSDGTWTCFDDFSSSEKVYIGSDEFPQNLFPNLQHKFLCSLRAPAGCKNDFNEKCLNLHKVDKESFVILLKLTLNNLPHSHELSLNVVPWFSLHWLQSVWNCIKNYFPKNLSPFKDLPLIFVPHDRVLKLNNKPAFIGTAQSDNNLPIQFWAICQKLGITVVESHKYDIYNHISLWGKVILPPRIKSVLTFLIQKVKSKQLSCNIFSSFTSTEIEYFINNLVSETSITLFTQQELDFLRTLQIFKTIGGKNMEETTFVCLDEVNISTEKSNMAAIPVPPCKVIINLNSDSYVKLAQRLSVALLGRVDLIEKAYFPGLQKDYYSHEQKQMLIQYICKNINFMTSTVITSLAEMSFVTRPGASSVRPKDLFDYKDETLIILLEEKLFPSTEWRCPEYYTALIVLGLKKIQSLTTLDIINVIENLSRSPNQTRFKTLLSFFDRNFQFLNAELKSKIVNIKWIPIKKQKPDCFPPSLPFYGENSNQQLACYNEVFSSDLEKIIGSICSLVESGCLRNVENYFGWKNVQNPDLVFQHLKNLVENFNKLEKFQVLDLLKEIYKYLNYFSSLGSMQIHQNDFPWVWVGEEFVNQSKVVMNAPSVQLQPYCFPLPSEIKCFSKLWQAVGISNDVDLSNILKLIKFFHENNPVQSAEIKRDINIAVNILNHISETNSPVSDFELLIPIKTENNSQLKMELLKECVYCEKNWYELGFDLDDLEDDLHLIHELIPIQTAERLGIPSCMSKILDAEEFDNSFGQSEPLTTRLRGLLKDYTDGLAVLKELIQNADDANATEVSFVYDERENSDARTILLDKNMEELQGPAIWCHNNATFTKEDFQNIVKLGGATKERSQAKVGKFGLGFNSVYNLTEVPIFVSNNSIVFFDPHTKYLGKALTNKNSPGMKLDLPTNHGKIQRLKDQFKPFNGMFGCDFNRNPPMKNYAGTLFRFPLRTVKQARSSEICNKHYDRNEVIQLLNCLSEIGDGLLMFTQNVTKITVYHIADDLEIKNMKEIFSINKTLTQIFNNSLNVKSFSYLGEVSKNISQLKPKNLKAQSSLEFVFMMETSQKCNDEAATSLGLPSNSYISYWMVSWCTGVELSFQLFCKNPSWLPIGAVAAKLEIIPDGSFLPIDLKDDQRGYLYCFLPLLTKTQLPIHVNGYFRLNSSRTQMYMKDSRDKEDERAVWNEALLQDAVALSYCNLLKCLTSLQIPDLYNIFPCCLTPDESFLNIFAESVFFKMFTMDLNIFKSLTNNNWCRLVECSIIGIDLKRKSFASSIKSLLINVAQTCGKHLADIPDAVLKCMMKSKQANKFKTRTVDEQKFYETWFIQNLNILPFCEREDVIVQTIIQSDLCKYLIDSKCIPVTPSGTSFEFVSNLIDPSSILGPLYDEEDGKFPFISKKISNTDKKLYLKKLKELGMETDSILSDEIIERCKSIENDPSKLQERLPILLKLINDEVGKNSGMINSFISKTKSIKMFPVLNKPEKYPFSWKTSCSSLVSCDESFLENKKLLAGPSCLIIDESHSFNGEWLNLKKLLGLTNKLLPFESLLAIIGEISNFFDENNTLKDSSFDKLILKIMDNFYSDLKLLIESKTLDKSHFTLLSNTRFVLVKDKKLRLFLPEQCSMNISKPLLPYLCGINDTTLTLDEEILLKFGIKETFDFKFYQSVLLKLEKQFNGKKLDQPNLTLSLNVVECIYDCITNSNQEPECDFYMPNKKEFLCLASELKFDNCNWTSLKPEECCHPNVSWAVATKLGIKSVRQDVMIQNQFSLPFGQKEKLVNRIKRILTGYPLNEDILKEMLQNADDAGATEIHFIKDTRQLPDEKIFGSQWKPLQGPALSIYNNKSFTVKDLEGIQNLGEGSKQDDITKTGQYGVGFNCVYHLTDVPSFLTTIQNDSHRSTDSDIHGTVLGIFDPNCQFLSEASSENPGALYKVEMVSEVFTDVYKGYLQDIPAYDVSKEGTVFRLPLRNDQSKDKSKLNGHVVTVEKVTEILSALKDQMGQDLFFLKSLECLTLAEIKETNAVATAREIHKVRLIFSDEGKQEKNKFVRFAQKSSQMLQEKSEKLAGIGFCEALYEVSVDDNSKSKRSEWIIVQRFGFEEKSQISQSLCESYDHGMINLQPCGGVALCKSLLQNKFFRKGKGRIFNFLPLPIITDLPFHINGHFVMSHESRRGLWHEEHKTFKSEWNDALISHIIVPAFCSLLCYLKEELNKESFNENFNDKLLNYYKIFPVHDQQSLSQVKLLTTEVYKYIFEKKLKLFLLYKPECLELFTLNWTDVQGIDGNVFFDDLDQQLSHGMSYLLTDGCLKKASVIRDILFDSGMQIINCPMTIFYNFNNADVKSVKKISPENVLKHLSASSTFDNLPVNINYTIFENHQNLTLFLDYTKEEIHKMENISELTDLPFILTSDNVLHKFRNNLSLFKSKHRNIAPHKSDKFIHSDTERYFSYFKKNESFLKILCTSDAKELINDFKPSLNYNEFNLLRIEDFLKLFDDEKLGSSWIKSMWAFLLDLFSTDVNSKKEDEFKSKLVPLQNLCIIPVIILGEIYLYPFNKLSCILKNELSGHSEHLYEILKKLGTPILNFQSFKIESDDLSSLLCSVTRSQNNLGNILSALEEALFHLKHQIVLNKDECHTILNHFAQDISALKSIECVIKRLRELPFYTNMNNEQVHLGSKTVYVFPSRVPEIDIEKLTLKNSVIFLKEDDSLSKLFEILNCESLTERDAYMKFILKEFQYLDDDAQLNHLKFLRLIVSTLCFSSEKTDYEAFLTALKNLHFIRCSSGELQKASYFYDVENPIFKLMDENFLPPPFKSEMWKSFLTQCGFVTKLTQSKFIEYAEQVRTLPSNKKAETLSSLLVQHFNINYKWCEDTSFLASIKSIPFLLSPKLDDRLLNLFPPFSSSKFIAFENSNLYKNRNLCWTVSTILPADFTDDSQHLSLMKVKTKLDSSVVFNNMQTFCSSFNDRVSKSSDKEKKEKLKNFIQDITGQHLDVFNHRCDESLKKGFSELRFVYVEALEQLVQPIQIATNITDNMQIMPYLVRLPLFYGKYETFLLHLGATKKFTVKQCAWALEQIKNKVKDNRMDPNFTNISVKLLKMFLNLLSSLLVENKTELMELKYLYIPCEDEKLHQSNTVACDFEKSQLFKRLAKFDSPLLVNENAKELMKLPDHLKPKLLSELVQECLLKLGKETDLPSFVRNFEKLISHEDFEAAVEGIWLRSQNQDLGPEIRESKIESLHNKLKCIKFIGVESIETHILKNGIPINGSNSKVEFFFEVQNQENIFLKAYVTENLSVCSNFDYDLSNTIMNFCEIGRTEANLLEILLKTNCNKIQFFMEKHKLSTFLLFLGPPLGNEIRLEDHFKLIQDVLVLYPQQIVAYEVTDPFDKGEDGEAKFILVEVIQKIQDDFQSIFTTKYEINCGSYIDIVDTAKLYAFKSGDDDKSEDCVMLPIGAGPNNRTYSCASKSLIEALDEMKTYLKEIWILDEDRKRKILKRMFLKYHPDKNPENTKLFTELFKHLQILIKMLEDGENINDYGSGDEANVSSSKSSHNFNGYYSHSSSSYFNESFFDRMGSRARQQNYSQKKNNSGYSQYTSYRSKYNTFFKQFSRKPKRCSENAKLWMKQAEHDYETAENDSPEKVPSCKASAQWRCYKYYMAAQNSITATHYAKDSDNLPEVCEKLANYCSNIYDQELDAGANQLDVLLQNKRFLSEPAKSLTAFDNITEEMAKKAANISQNIMTRCKKLIKVNESL